MSDEEHQFESKADAGASKTYPQQAGTIRKGGYIVIKGRACKVAFLLSDLVFLRFYVLLCVFWFVDFDEFDFYRLNLLEELIVVRLCGVWLIWL